MSEKSQQNQDTSSSSPGAIFKRCREYHRITLEEAAEATKIRSDYLKALEEDRIEEFANEAYLKGFLRIYSTYLGLVPDDMLRLHEKLTAPDSQTSAPEMSKKVHERVRRGFPWKKLILPVSLLLLIVITATILNRSNSSIQQKTALAPVPVPAPVAAPVVQQVISSVQQPTPVQDTKTEETPVPAEKNEVVEQEPEIVKQPSEQPLGQAKSFVVRLNVTQNSSLVVTIDGAAPQDYDLEIGDIIEWKAGKNIAFELSNGGAVEAELDGKPLKPFGAAGSPAYVVIDAGGIKKSH